LIVKTDEPERDGLVAINRARDAYDRQEWRAACEEYALADGAGLLAPHDLERFADAALLAGRDAESADALSRAHHEFMNRGDAEAAAGCAARLGIRLLFNGDVARGTGWLSRARRVLDESGCADCAVHGYLLIPAAIRAMAAGDGATALANFGQAVAIGQRFDDNDLVLLARHGQGRVLVRTGKVAEGVELFDEVMIGVTAGEASPVVVGDVYCSVISACADIFDFRRAQEWTSSLSAWCAAQPDLVYHRGECLVHRAELAQVHGAWADAMRELTDACERLRDPPGQRGVGVAFYQQAELHRLRGEFEKAEEMFRLAHQAGRPPQPGLALLRLAQGRLEAATASIRNALDETPSGPRRSRVLSAFVEIMLAAKDTTAARAAAAELSAVATELPVPFLRAAAAHALGSISLAEGDARGALARFRVALASWQELDAPYEAARTRELAAIAHRLLGDTDSAAMDLDAAVRVFAQLGATTDIARIDAKVGQDAPARTDALTPREVEVLRLIATGKTNRSIAAGLGISEKTVARHVSNIFMKLGLSSRAAATAYAYEHDLTSSST
jgi:DNA-binding NarL/FixJ family response regulator